jgi:hypothetical protein
VAYCFEQALKTITGAGVSNDWIVGALLKLQANFVPNLVPGVQNIAFCQK